MSSGTFVKVGYDYRDLIFENCIARNEDGEIVGIILEKKLDTSLPLIQTDELPEYFKLDKEERTELRSMSTNKPKVFVR